MEDNTACEQSNEVQLGRPIADNRAIATSQEYYEVRITKAENGFILKFGCKTFVALTWDEASKGIGEYFADPNAAYKKYVK